MARSIHLNNLKDWLVLGVLLAGCFLTYSNSLHNPFLLDDLVILNDPKTHNLKFLPDAFNPTSAGIDSSVTFAGNNDCYRPFMYIIFVLCRLFFGDNSYGFHAVNFILFVVMCFSIYLFIRILFKGNFIALLTAFLFSVHPFNSDFVDYITTSADSLMIVLEISALILFLKKLEDDRKNIHYFSSLLCFGAALMCHETAVVLPLYILFTSLYFSRRDVRGAIFKTWPFFLILLLYLLFRLKFFRSPGNLSYSSINPDPQRILSVIATFSKLVYSYFSKFIFPQFSLYSWNFQLINKFIYVWIGGLLLLFSGWCIMLRSYSKSVPFFCSTWMMLGFLPVIAACPMYPKWGLFIEPHWLSFASIGCFLFISWAVIKLSSFLGKSIVILLCISLLIFWAMFTRETNWIWGDEVRYFDNWQFNIESKKPLVFDLTLGDFYLYNKNFYLAKYFYRKVIKTGDLQDSAMAYDGLGLIDYHQGYLRRAQKEYLLSLQIDSANYRTLNNLAEICIAQSNYKTAKIFLLRALELNKFFVQARFNLALISEKESNYSEAIKLYVENLDIVPYEEQSLLGLVRVYIHLNDVADIRKYSQLLIMHGQDPIVLTDLGSLLGANSQFIMASDAFNRALRIDTKCVGAYLEAGKLLANARMYDEAIRLWGIGQKIDPREQGFKDCILKATILKSVSK